MDNKWIETKDRLPECTEEGCSEEVLICVNGCVISGMHYWICDNIFMDEMDTVFSPSEVSHWMNLPEPPEVKKR